VLSVDESLILNGAGVLDSAGDPVGAFRSVGGTTTNTTWTGPVLLASNTSVGGDNGSIITVTGDFSGSANLTKIGLSSFILPNANPNFTGNTTIGNGTTGGLLIIRNGLSLGPTNG